MATISHTTPSSQNSAEPLPVDVGPGVIVGDVVPLMLEEFGPIGAFRDMEVKEWAVILTSVVHTSRLWSETLCLGGEVVSGGAACCICEVAIWDLRQKGGTMLVGETTETVTPSQINATLALYTHLSPSLALEFGICHMKSHSQRSDIQSQHLDPWLSTRGSP
ncbi:hypothetical protein DL95DRAFT_444535 [Leptodontidium sp. 2 PMI_412]|nr:hypothetical protein DL95DRAFT_444535 [Leptodontidium sp. 2 PMI_412]